MDGYESGKAVCGYRLWREGGKQVEEKWMAVEGVTERLNDYNEQKTRIVEEYIINSTCSKIV